MGEDKSMFATKTKILFCDDMGTFRMMIKNALQTLRLTNYTEAEDGETALRLLLEAQRTKEPFELILSDWNMPKMSGIDFLKKVRSEPWGKSLPFIMLTGETEKENIMEALENKVTQYVVKPFTVDGLREKLQSAYAKWAAETGVKKSA